MDRIGRILSVPADCTQGPWSVRMTARELAAYLALGIMALVLILCSMTAPMLALLPNLPR